MIKILRMLPKDSKAICSLHDFWYKGKKVGIWMGGNYSS
jgi:hypothetical protein